MKAAHFQIKNLLDVHTKSALERAVPLTCQIMVFLSSLFSPETNKICNTSLYGMTEKWGDYAIPLDIKGVKDC